ncbi:MAG TPA: fibronectin type III domain-containing protein [Candidatus Binatia bacterium]|jgi:hypothetical protein
MTKLRVSSFRFRVAILVVGSIVALSGTGCGAKGALRAPEGAVPEPITDLRAKAGKQGVVLTWGRPQRYVDGKELTDLASFVIFRKELAKNCPDCPSPYRQLTTVDVEDQQKFIKRKQFGYVDQEVQPGTVYRYRVFSKVADGSMSDPSNEAEVTWRAE